MKKIKGLLFAFVALFAFTLAVVTIKAEGEPIVFAPADFYTSTEGVKHAYCNSTKASPDQTSVTKNGVTVNLGSGTHLFNPYGTVATPTNETGKTFTEELASGGTKTWTVTVTLEASQTANVDLWWYAKDKDKTFTFAGTDITTTDKGAGGYEKQTVYKVSTTTALTSGANSISINVVSNIVLLELDVRIETSSESTEDQAIAAIDAIGTVEYTQACLSKIQTAKLLVEASSNQADITNLSTYQAAVEAFAAAQAAAIEEFVNGVNSIEEITADTYSTYVTLKAKYDALLASDKAETNVVMAYNNLLNTLNSIYHESWDNLSKSLDATDLTSTTYTAKEILGNSIFMVTADETRSVSKDVSNNKGRIKLGGTHVAQGTEIKENGEVVGHEIADVRTIEFYTRGSGILKVSCQSSTSTADRKLNLYYGSIDKENNLLHQFEAKGATLETGEYHIEEDGGRFILGSPDSGVNIYTLEFIPDPEPHTEVYFDSGYNAAGTELIRVVVVAENVPEDQMSNLSAGIKVVIAGEGLSDTGFDVTSYFQAGDSITSNGAIYSVTDDEENTIECGVKANTMYAIIVVAVSNDGNGLAEEYVGTELTITLGSADGHETYYTWHYTVQGAQA